VATIITRRKQEKNNSLNGAWGGGGEKNPEKTTNCLPKLKFPPQKRQLWGRYLALRKSFSANTKFEIMRACSSTQTPNLLILFAHHHIHTHTYTHTYIHTHIHTDAYIHTHGHTYTYQNTYLIPT
jgi:hypothetical protein